MLAARVVRDFSGANEVGLYSGVGMRQEGFRGARTWKQLEALSPVCHFSAARTADNHQSSVGRDRAISGRQRTDGRQDPTR